MNVSKNTSIPILKYLLIHSPKSLGKSQCNTEYVPKKKHQDGGDNYHVALKLTGSKHLESAEDFISSTEQ